MSNTRDKTRERRRIGCLNRNLPRRIYSLANEAVEALHDYLDLVDQQKELG
jgi:hypothetical protein